MVWGLCIFNLFLLWFPKVENIGRKAAVNSPPYFLLLILFLIICQHCLRLYASVLRKEIPSYEKCRMYGTPGGGGAGAAVKPLKAPSRNSFNLLLQLQHLCCQWNPTRGIWGISLVSWDSRELGLTPPTPRCCRHFIRSFHNTCHMQNFIIQQGFHIS